MILGVLAIFFVILFLVQRHSHSPNVEDSVDRLLRDAETYTLLAVGLIKNPKR